MRTLPFLIFGLQLGLGLSGCSLFETSEDLVDDAIISSRDLNEEDYLGHLEDLADTFLTTNRSKILRYSNRSKQYLDNFFERILSKNEIFFIRQKSFRLVILKDNVPYYFSSPKGRIFVSSELINQYIENESFLASILIYEMIRIEKMIYPKALYPSRGYLGIQDYIRLQRVELQEKHKIHRWAFYLLSRTSFDQTVYMTWLQMMNRHYLKFSSHLGETTNIFSEERQFKEYIKNKNEFSFAQNENSKSFFRLKREVSRYGKVI